MSNTPAINLPYIVTFLVLVNIACYILLSLVPSYIYHNIIINFSLFPDRYETPTWMFDNWFVALISLISYAFLHGGWLHLIANMIFLAVFGNAITRVCGTRVTLFIYVTGIIIPALAVCFLIPSQGRFIIGASGAIMALAGAMTNIAFDFKLAMYLPHPFNNKRNAIAFSVIFLISSLIMYVLPMLNHNSSMHSAIAVDVHLLGFISGAMTMSLVKHQPRGHL